MNYNDFVRGFNSDISLSEDERRRIIKSSVEHDSRVIKCVIAMEEFAELQQQISKQIRMNGNSYMLLEEIADAYICLDYLKLIFNIDEDYIRKSIDVKLDREKNNLIMKGVLEEKE